MTLCQNASSARWWLHTLAYSGLCVCALEGGCYRAWHTTGSWEYLSRTGPRKHNFLNAEFPSLFSLLCRRESLKLKRVTQSATVAYIFLNKSKERARSVRDPFEKNLKFLKKYSGGGGDGGGQFATRWFMHAAWIFFFFLPLVALNGSRRNPEEIKKKKKRRLGRFAFAWFWLCGWGDDGPWDQWSD